MLGGMIAEHDAYREGGCKFIFVPGPLDPGPGNILPRPHLPNFVTERFVRRIPNAVFTSNPCRCAHWF
jgi:DNA polymerase epsilon subunit 2